MTAFLGAVYVLLLAALLAGAACVRDAAPRFTPVPFRSEVLCRRADAVVLAWGDTGGRILVVDALKGDTALRGATIPLTGVPVDPYRRYLLFGAVSGNTITTSADAAFVLGSDGVVSSLTGRPSQPVEDEDLHGLPEVDVVTRIRGHVADGRCPAR